MNFLEKLFPKPEYTCETCDSQFTLKKLEKHTQYMNDSGRSMTRKQYGDSFSFATVPLFTGDRAYCPKCFPGIGNTADYKRTVVKLSAVT